MGEKKNTYARPGDYDGRHSTDDDRAIYISRNTAMTTKEAFSELVNSPYLWDRTGQTKAMRRWWKNKIETKGEWPKVSTMDELLEKTQAFEVVQERKWGMTV